MKIFITRRQGHSLTLTQDSQYLDIVSQCNAGLKTLLLEGLSDSEFYGDLVHNSEK